MMSVVLVFALLVVAVFLFASGRYPVDLVAVLILAIALLSGLVTPEEGLSGFSSPATVTIGAMFVLSAGLQKTGALSAFGRILARLGHSHWALLLVTMTAAGTASAFINNTPVVAVLMPIVLAVAAKRGLAASTLLIPLSFASQFGGMCTVIGTSTNLLVSSISDRAGLGPLSMFELGRLGGILFAAGVVYFLLVGRWLLPNRPGTQRTESYQLGGYISELRVTDGSPLIGKALGEWGAAQAPEVIVLKILRGTEKLWPPEREQVRAGDVLLVRGRIEDLMDLRASGGFEIEPEFMLQDEILESEDLGLVEAVVAPRSRLIGHTLADLEFSRAYRGIVLAIRRRGQPLRERLSGVRLGVGDELLLQASKEELGRMRATDDLLVLAEVAEPYPHRERSPVALGIVAAVVTLAALGVVPILTSAIAGAAAMVLSRCVTLEEAYGAIDWKVILLLAGVFPLGVAMAKTGAAQLVADQALRVVGGLGPIGALAAIYLLAAVLTELMSNNAAALLLAPIAISTALQLGVHPKPFLIAVAVAASTSFATPVGYQTNTMVYNAGGYRFTDFMKVGIPLNIIFWALSVYFIPRFWPL